FDMVGSVNSASGVMAAANFAPMPTLVVLSDVRTGLPGGADESGGGDGAVAFLYAPDQPALLEFLGWGAATAEFLDRWRLPVDDLTGVIGNTGTAHSGVVLADLLDRAEAGKTILRVVLADGAIATVVRTPEALPQWRERRPSGATVAEQIAAGNTELSYPTFL